MNIQTTAAAASRGWSGRRVGRPARPRFPPIGATRPRDADSQTIPLDGPERRTIWLGLTHTACAHFGWVKLAAVTEPPTIAKPHRFQWSPSLQPLRHSFRSIAREKGFVVLTKSFVKIGITKTFCYNNKMFSSVNKTFGCCREKFLVAATKILFVVPNFVAVTKPFFPWSIVSDILRRHGKLVSHLESGIFTCG